MENQTFAIESRMDFDSRWDTVEWSEKFAIGDKDIDADHQKLLSLFNEFSISINTGKGDAVIRGLLDELRGYTSYHFSREQSLMIDSRFPDYEHHKKMHDTFIRQIDDVASQLCVGGDMCAFLLSFLGKWFTSHILEADCAFGEYLARYRAIKR